jgi:ABC-2 type transport system permease protein
MRCSVSAEDLLLGKIMGMGLVSLLQFLIWIVVLVLGHWGLAFIYHAQWTLLSNQIWLFLALHWDWVLIYFFYFISGYGLYSLFFATMGSWVDAETDTQQFSFISLIPLGTAMSSLVAFYTLPHVAALKLWLKILSVFPPTAPVVMVGLWPTSVSPWFIVLSMGLLWLCILILFKWSAKQYEKNILVFGKPFQFFKNTKP